MASALPDTYCVSLGNIPASSIQRASSDYYLVERPVRRFHVSQLYTVVETSLRSPCRPYILKERSSAYDYQQLDGYVSCFSITAHLLFVDLKKWHRGTWSWTKPGVLRKPDQSSCSLQRNPWKCSSLIIKSLWGMQVDLNHFKDHRGSISPLHASSHSRHQHLQILPTDILTLDVFLACTPVMYRILSHGNTWVSD